MKKKSLYPIGLWILAIGMTINVTGNSFLWPLNTIYITGVLHKSMSIAGFVLMLQQGSGILGNLAGGWLFDKWGGKKTIVIGIIFSAITVLSLAFFHQWLLYVLLMLLLGFSNGLVFPSMYAMAGSVWPEGGPKAFNLIYVAQNLGVAIGSTLGGVVAQISFTWIFIVNSITFLIFLLLVIFGFRKEQWQQAVVFSGVEISDQEEGRESKEASRAFVSLMILATAFVIAWMPYVQWQTSLSKYISNLGIPLSKYTLLWTINGALIVLGQPLFSLITKKFLTTIKKQMMAGIVIFILSFAIMLHNSLYIGFVFAMITMTLAEMLVWPAVPAAAADLAPENKAGFYQGVVSSAGAGGRMLGFLIGGWLYDHTSIPNLLWIMMGLFVISGLAFMNYDRGLKRKGKKSYA
ncbi:MDR family MFS transporter [Tepidibacillus fermentans]|uniref:Putative MFS family arabinose efflux permease n=1 Tax=Tepidibacillus fermentans TaxID=1281767 RepID=A0A4R3KK74_9BACI|nr:MFS transporter [Tepidibacillus fermentans]TCS84193.1 putative MFS family arabinose efflux permease [Tepidibacillus fermentans]